jgi:hypothetical protein
MPYFKMVRGRGKQHIAINVEPGGKTLCGRTIPEDEPWKTIQELSGDECERCAQKTGWVTGQRGGPEPATDVFDLLFNDTYQKRLPKLKPPG